MRYRIITFIGLFLIALFNIAQSQSVKVLQEDSILQVNGEVYFTFKGDPNLPIDTLTRLISIDHVKGGNVYAYANKQELNRFKQFGISYALLPSPGSLLTEEELNMGGLYSPNNLELTTWNFYPTYSQYLTYMNGFATAYPSICKLDTIGKTSKGRLILAVKISDSVNYDRGAPQVLLTSSLHGDETTAYILMMHLIDSLLSSYGTSARITNMINHTQIYINPLANPDGTYKTGDNTVVGSVRSNANSIDLNRNFADPRTGQHPDGNMWQPETEAFMKFADYHHFNLAINFHGGAEVVNYPWDTWNSSSKVTADDSWWQFVSNEYADTAQYFGPSGYFTDVDPSGITNGGDWYVITGGRQDYHNYFKHVREVTLEISSTKQPAASTLLNYWKYNYRSFLNYIEQSAYGIRGLVYDSITYDPIAAKVYISGFDVDSSWVYSSLPSGWYFRMIDNGTRALTFSAPGYYSRTISGVTAARYDTTNLNVKLRPIDAYWVRSFYANPVTQHQINLSWSKNGDNDPVLIAYNTSNTFGTPVNGTVYSPGMNLTGGGFVIYNGSDSAFPHEWLEPGTTYYYRAWSVRAGNTYSNPAATSATTYCGTCTVFPITESFSTATVQLPNCWSQEATGTSVVFSWGRNGSNSAGGTAWEMRSSRQSSTAATSGTLRLKTFFFNTTNISLLTLSFKHFIDARSSGVTMKIQSSTDGVTWTDESWSVSPTTTNIGPATITLNITNNLNSPTTMIAFVVTGNPRNYDYWYIDDVSIKAPGYWIGGTFTAPTDWNTTTNWGDWVVPLTTTNAYIPKRPYLPIVTNDPVTPAVCKDLTIDKDASVTVNPSKQLNVHGNLILKAP